jgi:hypothetical protein
MALCQVQGQSQKQTTKDVLGAGDLGAGTGS